MDNFDFNKFEAEAINSLQDGQGLLGKEGVLTPLLKRFLEKALEAELDHHLDQDEEKKATAVMVAARRKLKQVADLLSWKLRVIAPAVSSPK